MIVRVQFFRAATLVSIVVTRIDCFSTVFLFFIAWTQIFLLNTFLWEKDEKKFRIIAITKRRWWRVITGTVTSDVLRFQFVTIMQAELQTRLLGERSEFWVPIKSDGNWFRERKKLGLQSNEKTFQRLIGIWVLWRLKEWARGKSVVGGCPSRFEDVKRWYWCEDKNKHDEKGCQEERSHVHFVG